VCCACKGNERRRRKKKKRKGKKGKRGKEKHGKKERRGGASVEFAATVASAGLSTRHSTCDISGIWEPDIEF
jgi:hypothetical protein